VALATTLLAGRSVFGELLPAWAVWTLGCSLALGQAVMLACAVVALRRRGARGLLAWVAVLPVYWTLGAIAAWKAIVELAAAPYYWDKTRHGVSRFARASAPEASGRTAADPAISAGE
jgi:glycosyltransferase XagB